MELPALRGIQQSEVLDVWDRQFLAENLKKAEQSAASIFMVNIRVTTESLADVLQQSGVGGCYVEERSVDGRQPSSDSQVVWLPKKTYAEAVICQQANKAPCQLVRSGNRYGLRVANPDAEQTHMTHRPDVVYLNGNLLLKFKVGPLPFGSSKQSIASLFKKWGWQARPISPAGVTRDKSGLQWLVQSTTNPDNWIYQTNAGDILIAPESTLPAANQAKQAIIASDKTIQSLIRADQQQKAGSSEDPWLHKDPWQSAPSSAVTTQQMQGIVASMEKRILKQLQEDDKMDVDTDKRVSNLEEQVGKLTTELHNFQQSTAQQQQNIQQQINSIDTKVESHHHSIHQLLETKLESQMARIEQLFTKRARSQE
jgi:hypothetical protein